MELRVNGKAFSATETQLSLAGLIVCMGLEINSGGVAISVNETLVPNSKWQEHQLQENDLIEIISANAGG